ncbi:MAG: T9SS type A sorting domain-containing protein, partial [Schleiferiaceae bacterium]|nr:T9SS type A sorting domain-containing protein [Schleiferiaceae bacterium]
KFIGGTPLSQHGAFLEGQSGTSLYVSASEFSNNQSGLYLNANIDARVSCSEFTSNEYGISVMLNSTLDIGDHAKNVFVNDYVDVHMIGDDEQHAIFLNEGFNDFAAKNQSGGLYLYGYNTQVPTFLGGGTQIPADNNKMPAYNFGILNNIMPVDFSFSQNNPNFPHATTAVTLDIPNNLSSIPYNCNGDVYEMGYSAHYRLVAAMPPGGGRISTNSYPFTSLREAALYAIEMVTIDEEERDDITALARFIEILNSPVSQPDAFTNRIQAVVYQQMHQALSNAYQNGSLQNVQDDASNGIHDTVAAVISIIDQLILDLDPTDTLQQPRYFKLHLDKVHAYRVSGHYTAAINVLASSANWTFNYAQTQRVGYWSCVCDAEAAYFNEELAPEEFGYSIEICNQTFAGYNYKRSTIEMGQGYALDTESKLHIGLHPQPAMTNLSMHLSEPFEGMMSYEILDVTGKKVQSGKSQIQGTMENVDVSKLSQGVYMIHIELGNTHQQTLKFVKG